MKTTNNEINDDLRDEYGLSKLRLRKLGPGSKSERKIRMLSAPIETIVKMVESLPETSQIKLIEKIRDYIEEMQDEIHWDSQFKKTENKLIQAARQAKKEIAEGYAEPMDYDRL